MFKDEFDEFRARADSGGFLSLCRPRFKQDILSDIEDSESDLGNPVPAGCGLASSWPNSSSLMGRAMAYARASPLGITAGEEDRESVMIDKSELSSDTNSPSANTDDSSVTCCNCIGPMNKGKKWNRVLEESDNSHHMRPRVSSMPSSTLRELMNPKRPSLGQIRDNSAKSGERIRCFKITAKGLVREGDCYSAPSTPTEKNCERINYEKKTFSSHNSSHPHYTIALIGAKGVGKKHIVRQFQAPVTNSNVSCSFDDDADTTITLLLDGEEATLTFTNIPETNDISHFLDLIHADAYMIVYSVEDRDSFKTAVDRLHDIRREEGTQLAVILVANKTDLVRSRVVAENEGKSAAKAYDSKYIEVSAAIDHQIDELLAGTLKQIRLLREAQHSPFITLQDKDQETGRHKKNSMLKTKRSMFKLLHWDKPKSCKNLYVL